MPEQHLCLWQRTGTGGCPPPKYYAQDVRQAGLLYLAFHLAHLAACARHAGHSLIIINLTAGGGMVQHGRIKSTDTASMHDAA